MLISGKTALGAGPVSKSYLNWNLQLHGVSIERIRRDRVLHEALTARADPLHLALVFGVSHTTASRYMLRVPAVFAFPVANPRCLARVSPQGIAAFLAMVLERRSPSPLAIVP